MVEHIEKTVYYKNDITSFKHVAHYYWKYGNFTEKVNSRTSP